jgi:HAD superfamily hydrolase (TIGR01549 family)
MIKRIIFDLDDTLIPWKPEYTAAIKKATKEYNLPYSPIKIDSLCETYENHYNKYTIANFQEHAKKSMNIDLPTEYLNTWLKYLGNMSEENSDINDTLSYLSKKYELVILTNWFKDSQTERLKTARMYHYFKEIYGGDDFIKPSRESFMQAIGNHLPSECLMIGDNYKIDIEGAINAGLEAIYLTSSDTTKSVTTIKDLSELKNIL